MQSVIPPGPTDRIKIAGKDQGYLGLAVAYDLLSVEEGIYSTMTTAWEPSDAERRAISNGANIIVRLLGNPPINPMNVFVGDVPTMEADDG